MFCSKCGTENPDNGKFCRSCGVPINGGTAVAPAMPPQLQRLVDKKGKPISYESALAKIFTGIAFIVIACFLYFTNAAGGHAWGFWMLIPGLRLTPLQVTFGCGPIGTAARSPGVVGSGGFSGHDTF